MRGSVVDSYEPAWLWAVPADEPAIFKPCEVATAVLSGLPMVVVVVVVSWAGV